LPPRGLVVGGGRRACPGVLRRHHRRSRALPQRRLLEPRVNKLACQYALLRFRPFVETGEFARNPRRPVACGCGSCGGQRRAQHPGVRCRRWLIARWPAAYEFRKACAAAFGRSQDQALAPSR
jgi:hypothetical protein